MSVAGIMKQSASHKRESRTRRARGFKGSLCWLVFTMVVVSVAVPGWTQLSHVGDQLVHQDWGILWIEIDDDAEPFDYFGWAVVTGHFNDDEYLDLAIGIPYEDVGEVVNAGAVQVLYGSSSGISVANDQFIHQDLSWMSGVVEEGDRFGWSLAVGDFDNDGFDDLAIGIPYEDVDGQEDAGAVQVIYGNASGLGMRNAIWHQNDAGIPGACEAGDRFGWSLTAGDFNGDGRDDLVIGAPGEDLEEVSDAGLILLMLGVPISGLQSAGCQGWNLNKPELGTSAEAYDSFGYSLASGDFNGDGRDDLAIGIPNRDVSAMYDESGQVLVMYGATGGVTAAGRQFWHKDTLDGDVVWGHEGFGQVLAAGDINGDGDDDLVVGLPFEDLRTEEGDIAQTGTLHVIYGSDWGLESTGSEFLYQGVVSIPDAWEANDHFAYSLALGDFNNDGFDDVAIGSPYEDVYGSNVDEGTVTVVYGNSVGLQYGESQLWHQRVLGVLDQSESFDLFGFALAAGDFDNNGFDDLAIGVPGEQLTSGVSSHGAVHLLYGEDLRTLEVAKAGGGNGRVTSSPEAISCGDTCTGEFPLSTTVTLTAEAAMGSAFAGWSSSSNPDCWDGEVTVIADISCVAEFDLTGCALADGSGGGELAELYQPLDGAVNVSLRPTFEWQCITAAWDTSYQPAYYRVRVNTEFDGFYTTVCETTGTSCVAEMDLMPNTLYWVHVWAYDESDDVFGGTDYFTFTTLGDGSMIFSDGFESGDLTKWSSFSE